MAETLMREFGRPDVQAASAQAREVGGRAEVLAAFGRTRTPPPSFSSSRHRSKRTVGKPTAPAASCRRQHRRALHREALDDALLRRRPRAAGRGRQARHRVRDAPCRFGPDALRSSVGAAAGLTVADDTRKRTGACNVSVSADLFGDPDGQRPLTERWRMVLSACSRDFALRNFAERSEYQPRRPDGSVRAIPPRRHRRRNCGFV
jgi:hypothetical protein